MFPIYDYLGTMTVAFNLDDHMSGRSVPVEQVIYACEVLFYMGSKRGR